MSVNHVSVQYQFPHIAIEQGLMFLILLGKKKKKTLSSIIEIRLLRSTLWKPMSELITFNFLIFIFALLLLLFGELVYATNHDDICIIIK